MQEELDRVLFFLQLNVLFSLVRKTCLDFYQVQEGEDKLIVHKVIKTGVGHLPDKFIKVGGRPGLHCWFVSFGTLRATGCRIWAM